MVGMSSDMPTILPKSCSIDGCDSRVVARGWCSKHYTRWQRTGDPLAVSRTPPISPDATTKYCPRCKTEKPLGEFGKRQRGGPKGYCHECEADYDANYAQTDVGREARRMARDRWNNDNHEYFLKYRYGITKADYDRMHADQRGRCAICRDTEPGGNFTLWPVDHCHTTKAVRGLLCHRCNMGLGYFKDDPERLRAAITYLEGGLGPR